MAEGGAKSFPKGYEIYDNDASFGKKAPSLKPLAEKGTWLKGEPVRARMEALGMVTRSGLCLVGVMCVRVWV
jgi:hypothetical protein